MIMLKRYTNQFCSSKRNEPALSRTRTAFSGGETRLFTTGAMLELTFQKDGLTPVTMSNSTFPWLLGKSSRTLRSTCIQPLISSTLLGWGVIDYQDGYKAAGNYEAVLDSLRWSYDYLMAAHPEPNKIYMQVGDGHADHAFWGRPEEMTMSKLLLR